MYTTGRVVDVYGFSSGMKPLKSVPISTVGTVYVGHDGARYLLVIHQALFLGDKHPGSRVNPNQLRHHGLAVHDCPRQFDEASRHAIYVQESNVTIPLELDGVISYFESLKPTDNWKPIGSRIQKPLPRRRRLHNVVQQSLKCVMKSK